MEPPEATSIERPWHRAWPSHVPRSIEYPHVPLWWLLERNLPRFGSRVAVRELDHRTLAEGRVLTYEELWRSIRGVGTALREYDLGAGVRVGLCLPNGAALIVGYYATWYAGGEVVPANPASRAGELTEQLGDAEVTLIVGLAGGAAASAAEALGLPFVDADALRAMEATPPGGPGDYRSDEDVAVILYTGGTTGVPKGAMLTHRNLVANTIQFADWYAFAPGEEVSFCAIPMSHSGGMSGVMNVPLSAGATLLTVPRFDAAAAARAVERHRVTRLFGVPTMFIALLNDPAGRAADYASLRACRTNAAPLPPSVKRDFDALVGREVLIEGYGLTETSPLTHANPIGRAKAGSIGIPLPDTDARIVDLETGAEVAAGQTGELQIRGPQVMRGYWNRPDESARALREGWLATGDVATVDGEGYFAIVDRRKDMINTAGFKVWPREVEEALYAHEAVQLAMVIGVPDDYRGEAVKACVVVKDPYRGRVTEADLIAFCKACLTTYKVPRTIEFRDALPQTPAGKLLRRALREE
jgi:long-chain acyl-CoA synthetase